MGKDAAPLDYRRHGNAREVLILVPGLGSAHSSWRLMMATLAAEYTVIAVDNRRAARTNDGSAFSIADMADDIVALADHLGIRRFLLAGHSMGGAIAQTVAYRHPGRVEALALCNTFACFGDQARRLSDDLGELCRPGAARTKLLEDIVTRVFSSRFLTPQSIALVKSIWSSALLGQSGYDYHRQASALREFDSSQWVGSLRVPTLIVDSAEDQLCMRQDAERLAELIVGARRTTLMGGHASPIEQPGAFCEALLSFFRTRFEAGR